MLKKIGQDGDTIIEVLIAMMIIGLILVGAQKVTNNSSSAQQQAIEKQQAVELIQGQVEELRASITDAYYTLSNLNSASGPVGGNPFCFSTYQSIQSVSSSPPCLFTYSNTQTTATTPGNAFAISISVCQASLGTNWSGCADPRVVGKHANCSPSLTQQCPWLVTVTSTLEVTGVSTGHVSEAEYKVYSS